MTKRAIPFIIGLLLALAMAYISTLPTQQKHALHTQGTLHPWFHFFGFALVSFLLARWTRSQLLRVLVFGAMLCLGWGTEAHESGRNRYPIEVNDVHTDELGVSFGFVLALIGAPAKPQNV